MRKIPAKKMIALMLLLAAGNSSSAPRVVRVAFGDWSDAMAIGSAGCPGTTAGSSIVAWNGLVLTGSTDPKYLADAYCQTTVVGEFDADSFLGEDSPMLSRLVGLNTDNRVTAIRYTFLDRGRFDPDQQGFQWVIYSFAGTGVELVGFNSSSSFELTSMSNIEDPANSGSPYWSADQYPNGEYACFVRGSGSGSTFSGTYILLDALSEFTASADFGPSYARNECASRLTGAFADGFE